MKAVRTKNFGGRFSRPPFRLSLTYFFLLDFFAAFFAAFFFVAIDLFSLS
jgi:hypothetical protein